MTMDIIIRERPDACYTVEIEGALLQHPQTGPMAYSLICDAVSDALRMTGPEHFPSIQILRLGRQ